MGLDYSIAPGQACGLRSSLSDDLGGLPAAWRARLAERESCVCRVELNVGTKGFTGTGFLVAADVIAHLAGKARRLLADDHLGSGNPVDCAQPTEAATAGPLFCACPIWTDTPRTLTGPCTRRSLSRPSTEYPVG